MEVFQMGNFNQGLLNVKLGKGAKPFPTKPNNYGISKLHFERFKNGFDGNVFLGLP